MTAQGDDATERKIREVRGRLIEMMGRWGKLSPDRAERLALRLGAKCGLAAESVLPLFEQPDPSQFDPMKEPAWTLPMVAAWLAFKGDIDQVREWWTPYRSQLKEWIPRWLNVGSGEGDAQIEGWHLVNRSPATLAHMVMEYEFISEDGERFCPVSYQQVMNCVKAAGCAGSLRARGFCTRTGERRAITADEWQDLKYWPDGSEASARDVLRMISDRGRRLEQGFDSVTFNREDVVKGLSAPSQGQEIEGVAEPAGVARPTVHRIGRRPGTTEFDWDDAKVYALQELEKNGDFSNPANKLNNWKSQTDLERLVIAYMGKHNDREPAANTVRLRLPGWVDEWRSRNPIV